MIKTIDHIINIDLSKKINMNQTICIKENDNNSHKFLINILNNGLVYDLTGTTSRIYFLKKDSTKVFLDCTLDNALTGKISCILTTQALSCAGLVATEVTIYGTAGEILTSVTFNFIVLDGVRDDAAIESTSEFTALTNALVKVEDWNAQFQTKYDNLEAEYSTELNNLKSSQADIPNQSYITEKAKQSDLAITNANVSAIASGNPKGAYATLIDLQTAHPVDDGNIYVVGTSPGYIYDWIGGAWTNTNIQYLSTGISDKSVIYRNINKELFNGIYGYGILAKPSNVLDPIFIEIVYDLNTVAGSIQLTDRYNSLNTLYTNDANVLQVGARLYASNNVASISGGISGLTENKITVSQDEPITHSNVYGLYDPTYRYVHILLCVYLTDATKLADFLLYNTQLKIGNVNVPIVTEASGFLLSAGSTITKGNYTLKNQIVTLNNINGLIDSELTKKTDKKFIDVLAKSSSSTYKDFYVTAVFDVQNIALGGNFNIKATSYDDMGNIVTIGVSVWKSDNKIAGDLTGASSVFAPTASNYVSGVENTVNQVGGYFDKTTKYLHLLIRYINVDYTIFTDVKLKDIAFTVNGIVPTQVTDYVIFASTSDSVINNYGYLPESFVTHNSLDEQGLTKTEIDKIKGNIRGTQLRLDNWLPQPLKKLVFIGDSTTGVAPALFTQLNNYHRNSGDLLENVGTVINMGLNGSKLQEFNANIYSENSLNYAVSLQADLYVFCYGINDVRLGLTSLQQITDMMTIAIERLLKETNGFIVLRTPNPFLSADAENYGWLQPLAKAQEYTDLLWTAYESFRHKYPRVEVLDLQTLIFGRTCQPTHPLMLNILHPNDEGYRSDADEIAKFIGKPSAIQEWKVRQAITANNAKPYLAYPKMLENGVYKLVTKGYFVSMSGTTLEFESFGNESARIQVGDIIKIGDKLAYDFTGTVTKNGSNIVLTQSFGDTSHNKGIVKIFRTT